VSALPITDAQRAELARRYPHESNATLAAEFNLTRRQIAYWACSRFLKKSKTTLSRINREKDYGRVTAAQQIRAAVEAAGAAGLSITGMLIALPGLTETKVRNAVNPLTRHGRLHRAGPVRGGRWFISAAFAEAFKYAQSQTVPQPGVPAPVKVAPRRGPAHQPGPANTSAAVRVIACPPVGPALPTAPAEPGLFASLRPGRYIDDEARSWVSAITTRPA
jgi:hypothetical protein